MWEKGNNTILPKTSEWKNTRGLWSDHKPEGGKKRVLMSWFISTVVEVRVPLTMSRGNQPTVRCQYCGCGPNLDLRLDSYSFSSEYSKGGSERARYTADCLIFCLLTARLSYIYFTFSFGNSSSYMNGANGWAKRLVCWVGKKKGQAPSRDTIGVSAIIMIVVCTPLHSPWGCSSSCMLYSFVLFSHGRTPLVTEDLSDTLLNTVRVSRCYCVYI